MILERILYRGLKTQHFSHELSRTEVQDKKLIIKNEVSKYINAETLSPLRLRESIQKRKLCYSPTLVSQACIIEHLNCLLKWKFKVKVGNRNETIRNIIAHLRDTSPMTVFRTDIYSFYESIDRKKLLSIILKEHFLPRREKQLLLSFFEELDKSAIKGLPRGIPISATLSEIYLSTFDLKCRSVDDVIFYSRYVDDIFILLLDLKNKVDLKNDISSKLPEELNLKDNKTFVRKLKKVRSENVQFEAFDFLGYRFLPAQNKTSDDTRGFLVSISPNKIGDLKSKISKSFISFLKSKNYPLLKNRVEYLTGNILLPSNNNRGLKSGIYFNYPEITEFDGNGLGELDRHLKMHIYSHNCHIVNSAQYFSKTQKKQLSKYSFIGGHKNKFTKKITIEDFLRVTKAFKG
jgi:hypothetical protein